MYYLNSRYYNPEVGRFINADGYASTGQGVIGCNMFAYCGNNPINMIDPDGNCPIIVISILIRAIVKMIRKSIAAKQNQAFENPSSISDKCVDFIVSYEGFSATPYDDGLGNPTIGYGHLIKENESFTTITKSEAKKLFRSDISKWENTVSKYANDNNLQLSQNQFDALVSVAYNGGYKGLKNVTDKLAVGWDPENAFTCYHTKAKALNGGVSLGLWRRRMDECDIYVYGTYTREERLP